jgi:hypothetical protein
MQQRKSIFGQLLVSGIMISESTEDGWRTSSESSQASEDRYQYKKWRKEKTLMMDSRTVKKDMLVGLVEFGEPTAELDFTKARQRADSSARESLAAPFLLAWFDRKTWTHSPAIC